jgi:hypothetical protein
MRSCREPHSSTASCSIISVNVAMPAVRQNFSNDFSQLSVQGQKCGRRLIYLAPARGGRFSTGMCDRDAVFPG